MDYFFVIIHLFSKQKKNKKKDKQVIAYLVLFTQDQLPNCSDLYPCLKTFHHLANNGIVVAFIFIGE